MNSRKLLSLTQSMSPSIPAPNTTTATTASTEPATSFDANVIMVLSVLLCAVLCGLGINSIVRCAFRCSTSAEPAPAVQPSRVRRKAVRALPVLVFSDVAELRGGNAECAICLSDMVAGERVRVLPKCNHGFHVKCIDRWLMGSSSCPTCRQCLFPSKTKVAGCAAEDATAAAAAEGEAVVELVLPLEAEGFVSSFR